MAALSVLLFHLGRWLDIPSLAVNGGLSVDTFFTLSGFVLARAYADRIDLSTAGFLLLRAVRLMPIIALSVVISAPYVFLRSVVTNAESMLTPVCAAALLGLVNLPYFNAPPQIGGPQVFPLNGPQFSLFLEVLVNALWWSLRRISQTALAVCLYVACGVSVLLMGIGGDTTANFHLGPAHVGASFFAGVVAYQLSLGVARTRLLPGVFYALAVIMLLVFVAPIELPFEGRMMWKLLLAPALVLTGSFVTLSEVPDRLASLAGELSYPVYALHYPIFCWVNGIAQTLSGAKHPALEGVITLLSVILVSAAVLRWYDRPVRRHLSSLLAARGQRALPQT